MHASSALADLSAAGLLTNVSGCCHEDALMHAGASAFAAAAARVAAMAAAGAGSEFALPPLPPPARSSLGSSDGQRSANRLLVL